MVELWLEACFNHGSAGSYVDLMPEGKIAVPLLKRRGLYNKVQPWFELIRRTTC